MKTNRSHTKGAALITSLVLLLALTMVALSAIKTTTVQVEMSSNDQSTIEAQQDAQSVVDDVITNGASSFIIGANNGYTVCAAQNTGVCSQTGINLTGSMFTNISATSGYQAEVELLKVGTAPRMKPSLASSASAFEGAYLSVTGIYNGYNLDKSGNATVVQGYVLLLPKT